MWIGVHQESTYATILGPDGEIVAQRRVPNEEVSAFLRPHGVAPAGDVALCTK